MTISDHSGEQRKIRVTDCDIQRFVCMSDDDDGTRKGREEKEEIEKD